MVPNFLETDVLHKVVPGRVNLAAFMIASLNVDAANASLESTLHHSVVKSDHLFYDPSPNNERAAFS